MNLRGTVPLLCLGWIALALGVCLAAPIAIRDSSREMPLDRVVAEVDGEIVTARDLAFWMWEARVQSAEYAHLEDAGLSPIVLRRLADEILVANWAEWRLREADDAEIDRAADASLRGLRRLAPARGAFEDWLREAGWSPTEVRTYLRARERRLWFIRMALASRAGVRPEQMNRTERTAAESSERPVRFRLRHILIPCGPNYGKIAAPSAGASETALGSRASATAAADFETSRALIRALALRREILAGLPFAEAAVLYSSDAATRREGGLIGWVDAASLHPALAQAASGLAIDAVSAPARTPEGWHLVQVLDYDTPASLARVRRIEREFSGVLAELTKEKTIRLAEGVQMADPGSVDSAAGASGEEVTK